MTTLIEKVTKFALSTLSAAEDEHLFVEELGWVAGWKIGPVNATVAWVMPVCPLTHLRHPPHQLEPTLAWAPAPNHPPSLS